MHFLDIALSYFTLAEKFFNLASSSSLMIVKEGNRYSSDWLDKPISPQELDKITEWSDMNLSVPILFNFYHGIELTIKALLFIQNKEDINFKDHKFSSLCSKLEPDFIGEHFYKKIKSLTIDIKNSKNYEDIFLDFLHENNIDIDQWYQFLKYPFITDKKHIDFFKLKYKEEKGIDFWKQISSESKSIIKLSVKLYHKERDATYGMQTEIN